MATQKESAVVGKIKKWLEEQGSYVFKYHGSALSRVGVPDLICCWGGEKQNGRYVAIECKQGNGKPSKIQIEQIRRINESGGYAMVAWSLEEVIDAFKKDGLLD